jgi:hypothetical protein
MTRNRPTEPTPEQYATERMADLAGIHYDRAALAHTRAIVGGPLFFRGTPPERDPSRAVILLRRAAASEERASYELDAAGWPVIDWTAER